jgi:hypothetical protein
MNEGMEREGEMLLSSRRNKKNRKSTPINANVIREKKTKNMRRRAVLLATRFAWSHRRRKEIFTTEFAETQRKK